MKSKKPLLSELFFKCRSRELQSEIEAFRIDFEKKNGPTDITRTYTTMMSDSKQLWLLKNFPDIYYNGLPPFAKAFIQSRLEDYASEGCLDDVECPEMLRLFLAGKFRDDTRGRE